MNEIETRYTDGAFAARNPEFIAQQQAQQQNMSKLDEVTETMRSIGSGILGSIPAGVAGATALPFKGPEGAAQLVQDIQDLLTYIPDDPRAQAMVQRVGGALEMLGQPAKWVGNQLFEATGSPAAGAAGETLLDPLNLVGAAVGGPAVKATAKAAGGAVKKATKAVKESTTKFADGKEFGFDKIGEFLDGFVYGKEKNARIPNPTFVIGKMPDENVAKVAQFIDGFSTDTATVKVNGYALKHSDEQRHELFADVIGKLPQIFKDKDMQVLHNPSRENSAFVVHRRPGDKNALVIIEISATKDGTEVVNIISTGDRQLRQHEAKSARWLEGHRPARTENPSSGGPAKRNPAEGEFSDFQPPSDSSVITSIANDKASGKNPARKADE